MRARYTAASQENASTGRAESWQGGSGWWPGNNPNPDADRDDHERYDDHGDVDFQPFRYALYGLFGHDLVPLRILQRSARVGVSEFT